MYLRERILHQYIELQGLLNFPLTFTLCKDISIPKSVLSPHSIVIIYIVTFSNSQKYKFTTCP
jgi:hypothetical protein